MSFLCWQKDILSKYTSFKLKNTKHNFDFHDPVERGRNGKNIELRRKKNDLRWKTKLLLLSNKCSTIPWKRFLKFQRGKLTFLAALNPSLHYRPKIDGLRQGSVQPDVQAFLWPQCRCNVTISCSLDKWHECQLRILKKGGTFPWR